MDQIMLLPISLQNRQTVRALLQCNDVTARFSLLLSEPEIHQLIEHRREVLEKNGRIEFGGGVIQKIIVEFMDSPYLYQENYTGTLMELQECFYYFKNESLEELTDEELIKLMKKYFMISVRVPWNTFNQPCWKITAEIFAMLPLSIGILTVMRIIILIFWIMTGRIGNMNHLEHVHQIDENKLDQGFYFQSLLLEAGRRNLLTESQIENIQMELVELMGKEVIRYTNDESSSIPVEKAQEILQSISYNIGFYLKSTTDVTQKLDMLKSGKISDLFYKGMEAVTTTTRKAEQLLKDIQSKLLKLDNYAYQDTILTGIPEFFHNYELEFAANEIPGCFDYPLYDTITDLLGIEYIHEYLKRFSLEECFLRNYSEQSINRLVLRFDKEAEHILLNIFELVLTTALGCTLLGKKTDQLLFDRTELHLLQRSLETLNLSQLSKKLEEALIILKEELTLDRMTFDYSLKALPQIAVRLQHNLQTRTLDKLCLTEVEGNTAEEYYVDGLPMDNEQLRDLIEKLREHRITSDKIAIIKDTVRSQADFIELMNECFYQEEYEEVLASLNEMEKSVLRKSILLEAGQEHFEDIELLNEWQKLLFRNE